MASTKIYTAVLYFHGIGNPRRHVSIGQFLDVFDRFGQNQDKSSIGKPRDFKYGSKIVNDELVSYVEFKRVITVRNEPKVAKSVRVFEGYWAPESGYGVSFLYIIAWLFSRILTPWRVAFSTWRSFPGLRLATLHQLVPDSISQSRAQRLERAYRDYENWENRDTFPDGSLVEFKSFVTSRNATDAKGVDTWARSLAVHNIQIGLYTLLLSVVSMIVLYTWIGWGFRTYIAIAQHNIASLFGAVIFICTSTIAICGYRISRSYLADVVAWTADSERSEHFSARHRVVKYAQQLIRQVLSDPNCTECVIVGHSLGTCIATEALLREGNLAMSMEETGADSKLEHLAKVSHIFTIGSPLDRIFYLFQTDSSFSHRYSRMTEEQRLSITLPPFSFPNKASKTILVNFWSRFDPISSTVFSLRKNVADRRSAVQNIESIPPGIPLPIRTHTSYLSDPIVMGAIYWSIMTGSLPKEFGQKSYREHSLLWFSRWVVIASLLIGVVVIVSITTHPVFASIVAVTWFTMVAIFRARAIQKAVEQRGKFLVR